MNRVSSHLYRVTCSRSIAITSRTAPVLKITILGANGGIGQPLALLLKHSTICTHLNLYDLQGSYGLAKDLGHVETRCKVQGFQGAHQLHDSLENTDIVLISAGVPRRRHMTRDDLFHTNARTIFELVHACATVCPLAIIGVITNPINSVIPLSAEVLKAKSNFEPRRLFGITTLDVVRANTFIAEKSGLDPSHVYCPVIGGHSGKTIIPVISQCTPTQNFSPDTITELTAKIQEAGEEVVKAKEGQGSATVAMAYAAARFTYSLMRAIRGEEGVIECAYVKTEVEDLPYFSTPLVLGPNGFEKSLGVGKLNAYEKELLKIALPELKKDIEKGALFAKEKLKVMKNV